MEENRDGFDVMIEALKGGKGSGNFGHSGRPGKVGGSAPGKSGAPTRRTKYESHLISMMPKSLQSAVSHYGGGLNGIKKTISAYFKNIPSGGNTGINSLSDYIKELDTFIKNGAKMDSVFRENIDGRNYTFEEAFSLTKMADFLEINPFVKKKKEFDEFIAD